ncbi:MAG: YfiR family protein [Candidatus Thiodiazotropha endolucinida]
MPTPVTSIGATRRWRSVMPLVMAVLLWCLPLPCAVSEQIDEDRLKALFLYNFANYVTWPESTFKNQISPINYCLLGYSRLKASMNEITANEIINGRELRVVSVENEQQLSDCNILFIHQPAAGYPIELIQRLASQSVLTVSDHPDFIPAGGSIVLLKKSHKIKLVVNMDALDQGQLKVSSKLLRLATRVRPSKEGAKQ